MKLILVRHGESTSNKEGYVAGQKYDVPLTKEGVSQARKVAERLKEMKVDAIYASDLQRARQTAEEINKFHELPLATDKRIREFDAGIFTDLNFKGFGKHLDEEAKKFGIDREEVVVPEGESNQGFWNRVESFYKDIIGTGKENILIVGHGGAHRMALSVLGINPKEDLWSQKQGNTCINELELRDGKWVANRLNCMEHLE